MAIILDHVSYIYDSDTKVSHAALKDVSVQIPDGQFIGLIGHTGSGKSTLIQHLNGLLQPTSGSVFYNGKDISDPDFDRRKLRSKVGLVCFGPKNLGVSRKEMELRAYQALKAVRLEDEYFYQSPFDLSGGQKRRVAIAGVLAMKPEMLILDEPAAGLDPQGRDEILELLTTLHREEGITVLLVSHSMEDVANYVERILVMNDGQIVLDDVPKRVFLHMKELEQIGLAAPEVTYVMHRLQKEGFDVDVSATTIPEAAGEILRALRM